MICNNCGKEFEGNFCPECGSKAEVQEAQQELTSCPNCGAERLGEGKFCVNCGYSYVEPTQDIQPIQSVSQTVEESNKSSNDGGKKLGGGNFLKVFPKIYRWLLAGGMLLVGIISLLCLTAPVITENFLGESNPLCTGFEAISGKDTTMPAAVGGASKMLLVLSILALVYGGVQLFFAFKKPYINTIGKNKFIFWGIDGVISVLLIVSGGIMSSQAKSESLMDGKLGSGFAFAIVMGVFGLLFLAARVFYELKLFKIEDTGLSEEQIANLTEKKERKKLTKKQIMAIIIPVVTVAVLVAVIVPSVIWANNIFRIGKVDNINIGDSQEQVIKILGEPYEKNDYRYEYYSKEYVQLADKYNALAEDLFGNLEQLAKLEEQLNALTYQYIRIDFDSDKNVTEVFFDNAKKENGEDKKTVNSYELVTQEIMRYAATDIAYSVKFTDGSFYKGIAISNYLTMSNDNVISIKWTDAWSSNYYEFIKVKDNPDLLYAAYDDEQNVYIELDKNNVLNIQGNGSVTSKIDTDKTVKEIHIGSGITEIKMGSSASYTHFSSIIKNVEKITVDENNSVFRVEGNCLISRENNALILGCKSSQIPSNVTSIGSYAFVGCSSLTSIEIPSSVTSIGSDTFCNCSSLTSITVDSNNQVYKSDGNCIISKETNKLIIGCKNSVIPNYVTSIGTYAFYGCSSLTSVKIPSSVTSIGWYAFEGCSSLTSVTFGENSQLTSIGTYAFYYCSSLTSVTIPSSVTSIGNYAFYYCSSLTSVKFENTSGWYRASSSYATSGTSMDVTNASTNATNLTDTYRSYYWKRK